MVKGAEERRNASEARPSCHLHVYVNIAYKYVISQQKIDTLLYSPPHICIILMCNHVSLTELHQHKITSFSGIILALVTLSSCIIPSRRTSNASNEHSNNVSRNIGAVITNSCM